MRNKIYLLAAFLLLFAMQTYANTTEQMARQALSVNSAESEIAISALREAGQTGLDEMFSVYSAEISQFQTSGIRTENWLRISDAIDRVAMQKDAYSSRLYWFTDLVAAKLASKTTGKPILSLRLLGNLNEEYSCANSRFFRSLLYSNAEISKTLRESYILHWKSVRPAPRITVDFGDGRKIERTITGNSIHYILNENGKILEGLPGLYSPQEFARYLEIASNLHRSAIKNPDQLKTFHQMRRNQLINKWRSELEVIGAKMSDAEIKASEKSSPTALKAAPLAITKMAVELPMIPVFTPIDESFLKAKTNLDDWKKLSALFVNTNFDQNSLNLIRQQANGNKDLTDETFAKMIAAVKDSVSLDTVRNEYLFHIAIYKMLAENSYDDVESFNEAVYTNLFLTPRSDDWLGLYSPEVYSALDGNGITK